MNLYRIRVLNLRVLVQGSVIALLALALFPSQVEGQSAKEASPATALVGATVWVSPAEKPIRDGAVLIEGSKIVAVGSRGKVRVPAGTVVIDCTGMTITAGFWNSHVHFFERKWADAGNIPAAELTRQLQEMLTRHGFNSVFDLGSPWENTRILRRRIASGEVEGPSIRSTGEAILAPHAMPPDTVLRMMGSMIFPAPEAGTAEQADAAAGRLLSEGVDGIKIHLQPPPAPYAPMPDTAIAAVVAAAHRAGKPVFVHPASGADVLRAVRAGVDVVAHTTPFSGPWDDSLLAAMKQHNVALTPTLTVWKSFLQHDRISAREKIVDTEIGQLRAWLRSGGTVLFGNDLGAVGYDPSEEYELMAKAGMDFRQVLASLTTAPAGRFGDPLRQGRIAAGFDADLVAFEGDAAKNLHALTAVRYTLRGGRVVYRASPLPLASLSRNVQGDRQDLCVPREIRIRGEEGPSAADRDRAQQHVYN